MESRPNRNPDAIDGMRDRKDHAETYMANRRTLEFFLVAAVIGIGLPVAILLGVQAGERRAALIYSFPPAAEQAWQGEGGR
jgi:hypothetical protein